MWAEGITWTRIKQKMSHFCRGHHEPDKNCFDTCLFTVIWLAKYVLHVNMQMIADFKRGYIENVEIK